MGLITSCLHSEYFPDRNLLPKSTVLDPAKYGKTLSYLVVLVVNIIIIALDPQTQEAESPICRTEIPLNKM